VKMDLMGTKPKKQRQHLEVSQKAILFPEDILSEIFCHVGYKTLVRVASVCKTWRKIALSDKVWKFLTNRYSIYFPNGLKFPNQRISSLIVIHSFFEASKKKYKRAAIAALKKNFGKQEIESMLTGAFAVWYLKT
jgi:hypothetical protein